MTPRSRGRSRIGGISRRAVFLGAVGGGAALAFGGRAARAADDPIDPPAAAGLHLQVVAHQDDDLLFMGADLRATLEAGLPVVTVYLTAGEGSVEPGVDADSGDDPDTGGFTRERYAASRQAGARAAWARMAGAADEWTREAFVVGSGASSRTVELDTLAGRDVYLVFVGLPDWADTYADTLGPGDTTAPGAALERIWLSGAARRTVLATGSPVTTRQTYARDDLVRVLAGLYRAAAPTVVRVQDPYPDPRYWDNPGWYHDHSDHVMAARIAAAALAEADVDASRVQLVSHRCYNSAVSPANLDPGRAAEARDVFAVYATHDIAVDGLGGYVEWPRRVHRRWWPGTDWAARNADGRLQAFAVQDGGLVTWWQTGDGGWAGPGSFGDPGSALAPGLTTAHDDGGRLAVFGLRVDTAEIVWVRQEYANGGWDPAWRSLGTPPGASPASVGQPCALSLPDGRIRVFVTSGGRVATAVQSAPGGAFGPWERLDGGDGVQDGLAVRARDDGGAELFAVSTSDAGSRIVRWAAEGAGAGFVPGADFESAEPASPPTLTVNEDGRLDLFFRTSDGRSGALGAQVGHVWQRSDGSWATPGEVIPARGGTGPVTASAAPHERDGVTRPADSRILVFTHDRSGGVTATRQDSPNGGYLWSWTGTGTFGVGQPAALADGAGRVHALVVDGRGRLLANSQSAPGGSAPLTGWRVVAS